MNCIYCHNICEHISHTQYLCANHKYHITYNLFGKTITYIAFDSYESNNFEKFGVEILPYYKLKLIISDCNYIPILELSYMPYISTENADNFILNLLLLL